MMEGVNSINEFESPFAFFGGLSSKFHPFIWCYCDQIMCWCPNMVEGGLDQFMYPFVGRGKPHREL